jgi:SAM-dependent methyltransferase
MSVQWLEEVYWRTERLVAPGLKYSQDTYAATLDVYVKAHTEWLDLGCGHHILPAWRETTERALVNRSKRVVGVDRALPSLRQHTTMSCLAVADIAALPFAGETFDLVTANMVVEHLPEPEGPFGEVWRIMKPGGVFVFLTPNALGYSTLLARLVPERLKRSLIRLIQGRRSHDVFPTHYRVNTRKAIEDIRRGTGFESELIQPIESAAEFIRFPPIALIELLWIRMLRNGRFRDLRTNIIAVLRKPSPRHAGPVVREAARSVHSRAGSSP